MSSSRRSNPFGFEMIHFTDSTSGNVCETAIPLMEGTEWQIKWEAKRNKILRPLMAESVATFLYCLFGGAASLFVGISSLAHSQDPGSNIPGRFYVALAFAFGIMFSLFFAAPISGGHTAPNFTFAFTIFRKFSWKLAPLYFLAQIFGAFIATGIIYMCYYSTIHYLTATAPPFASTPLADTDGPIEFAALYVTRPKSYVSTGYIVWVEFISNAVLALIIFNLTDINNKYIVSTPNVIPPLIGLMIFLIIIGVGYQGVSINPARDIGARLFLWTIYGSGIWRLDHDYFWIAAVIPCIGSVVGAAFYDIFFYDHGKPKEL